MADTATSAAPAATPASTESPQDSSQPNEQLDATNAQAADPSLTKDEKKKIESQIRKYKLKVDGQEFEEELDLSNDEQVKKHLQMSKAATKKMQEAAQLRKAADQFLHLLKTNPRKILSDPNIGVDVKKLAEEIINEEVENLQKSPEQREREKLQKELEELKDRYKREEEDRKSAEFERLQSEQEQKLETDISDALDTGGLPKSPYTVKKMAEMMMIALQNNIDLSAKDVVPIIKRQMKSEIKEMFSSSSDDIIEEIVGKDRLSSLRKKNIAKIKQSVQTANSIKPTGNNVVNKPKEASVEKRMSIRDFLKV